MNEVFRLENGADPKGRRNEQVARSKAECQKRNNKHDDCHYSRAIDFKGGVSGTPSPTFLVNTNVKSSQRYQDNIPVGVTEGVLPFYEFRAYKQHLLNNVNVFQNIANHKKALVTSRADSSRYFPGGRRKMQRNIKKRLGRRWFSPGVLLTLTYDPELIWKADAWRDFSLHRQTLMHTLNTRRWRKDGRNLKCVWTVEAQKNGYPHLHIFFPGLHWLAPVEDLHQLWSWGRHECKFKDNVNVASYCCKYIAKLDEWPEFAQVCLWKYRKRVYGYSKCYVLPYSDTASPVEWAFIVSWRLQALNNIAHLADEWQFSETVNGLSPPLGVLPY